MFMQVTQQIVPSGAGMVSRRARAGAGFDSKKRGADNKSSSVVKRHRTSLEKPKKGGAREDARRKKNGEPSLKDEKLLKAARLEVARQVSLDTV